MLCLSPVCSLNFVRISRESLIFSFLAACQLGWCRSLSRHKATSAEFPYPADSTFLEQPYWALSQIFSCLFSSGRKWLLSFPSLPSSTAHGKIFDRACIVICPWSAVLQGFVLLCLFFCFFFSSCLDFIVSIAKQDCCRWSFLIFGWVFSFVRNLLFSNEEKLRLGYWNLQLTLECKDCKNMDWGRIAPAEGG